MAKMPGLNTWLNRTTKQFLTEISSGGMMLRYPGEIFDDSAGTPISNANWIHAPDLTAVAGQPTKYWIITDDVVTLMSAAEQVVVDSAALDASRDAYAADQLDQEERILRAFMKVMLSEINILRSEHSLNLRTLPQLRDAIRAELGS